jgi:hypothetical protein
VIASAAGIVTHSGLAMSKSRGLAGQRLMLRRDQPFQALLGSFRSRTLPPQGCHSDVDFPTYFERYGGGLRRPTGSGSIPRKGSRECSVKKRTSIC